MIGTWITLGCPQIGEIIRQSEVFDFIVVDMQHSGIDDSMLEDFISRINGTVWVRIRKADESLVCKAFDMGADGVIVPDVRTPNDVLYSLSYGLYRRRGYGFDTEEKPFYVIPQIEYPLSNYELSRILKHTQYALVGPYDLMQHNAPKDYEERLLRLARSFDVKMGYHIVHPTVKFINEKKNMGYDWLVIGTDSIAIGEWCRKWKQLNVE